MRRTHLSERNVTPRIHNIADSPGLLIPLLDELCRLGGKLRNLLVQLVLLAQQLRGIPFGLFDGPNLLLKYVDLAAGGLLLVLGWGSAFVPRQQNRLLAVRSRVGYKERS